MYSRKVAFVFLALLSACANQPNYTPNTEATRKNWTACRVEYENEHKPSNPYSFDATSIILGSAASDMIRKP
jgi:hypothetical protein